MDPTCDFRLRGQFLTTRALGRAEYFILLYVFFPHFSSLTEMEKWMEDINVAIETAKTSNGPSSDLLTSSLTDSSKSLYDQS